MQIIIAEDEKKAADKLINAIKQLNQEIEILAVFETVADTVSWLKTDTKPDLMFLDIQLSDGLSFEIFNLVQISTPVIFITAFEEYAIRAFKVNSIDYVLKPFRIDDIKKALQKYNQFQENFNPPLVQKYIESIKQISNQLSKNYKSRFFVSMNKQAFSIPVERIAFFVHEDKSVLVVDMSGQRYIVNYSLDTLETLLDPNLFFRINRSMLIHINSIKQMKSFEKGRISLFIEACDENPVNVSRGKTFLFKDWLNR